MRTYSVEEILDAFQDMAYPGDDCISSSNSIEASYVTDFFQGKEWTEISLRDLQDSYPGDPAACLSFMAPAAFRYYFPAYMKIAILQFDEGDAVSEVVLTKLSRAAAGDAKLREIFEGYEKHHLTAIARSLALIIAKHHPEFPANDAQAALDSYWGRYL